ncbi:MAG TPA: RNA polymerase sigma factor [Chloroflexota bacterium]|nr:RNA polymerase sigma factor [Chloroflexota bacterium]
MNTDDRALCDALAADLDGNFEHLVISWQDRLYRFALRVSGSPSDAEEIAQDAFVRCYRALQGYMPDRIRALSLRAWLYRITLNVARNRLRRRTPPGEELGEHAAGTPDPGMLAVRAERVRDLQQALTLLPEVPRAAVVLRYVEELSYGEIAGVLGIPEGTARSHVHRGLRTLRELMTEEVTA